MKKLLVLLFLLSAVFLFGRGRSSDKITIKVLSYGDLSSPGGKADQELFDNYEKTHPNIKLDLETLYDEAYHQKATALISSGDLPDIMYLWANARSNYAYKDDILADLRDDVDLSRFYANSIKKQGPNGEVYVLPQGFGITSVLYANTAILKKLNLSVPKTYEDLVAMLPVIRKNKLIPVAMANADGWVPNSTLLGTLIGRYGGPGTIKKIVEGKEKADQGAFSEGLKMYARLYKDGVLTKQNLQTDYGTALTQFINGESVFLIDGHWRAGGFTEKSFADGVEWVIFPKLPGEKSSYSGSLSGDVTPGYAITKQALKDPAKKKAVLELFNYLTGEPGSRSRLKQGVLPGFKMKIDPSELSINSRKKEAFYQEVPVLTDVIDSYLPPATNTILNNGLQEMGLGKITPEALAKKVQDSLDKEL